MRGRQWACPALLALLAGYVSGCGPSNGLTLGRVQGKVTQGGGPVVFGDVVLLPDESKGTSGPPSMGTIDRDGAFTLSTETSGDGAVVGFHRVAVRGLDPTPLKGRPLTGKAASYWAGKAQTTPTRPNPRTAPPTTVTRGRSAYRLVTPLKLSRPDWSGLAVEVKKGRNTLNITIRPDGTAGVEP